MRDLPALPTRFHMVLTVTAEPLLPALERFLAEVCELAEAHPGITVHCIKEHQSPFRGPESLYVSADKTRGRKT